MKETRFAGPAAAGRPGRAAAACDAKAQRRPPAASDDPARVLFKKTTLCRFFSSRSGCERGAACPFAHGRGEMRSKPDLKKTSLCKLWAKGRCPSESQQCPWAHGTHELQRIRAQPGELGGGEQGLADCLSAVASGDSGDSCFKLDGRAGKTGSSRPHGDVPVVFLEASALGASCSSDDDLACGRPRAREAQKECPRCGMCGHTSTACFCVRCGYALVDGGQPPCQPQEPASPCHDGCSAQPAAAAAPVLLGEPWVAVQGPWPVGACPPGTVMLMPATPQGWVLVPSPAPFAGDLPVPTCPSLSLCDLPAAGWSGAAA